MTGLTRFSDILDQNDLLHEVLEQLHKDFNTDASDFAWNDGPHAYHQFRKELQRYIRSVYDSDLSRLKSMLYRVDVSEKKLNRIWVLDKEDQVSGLVGLVLDRELQKVLTRRMFRNK